MYVRALLIAALCCFFVLGFARDPAAPAQATPGGPPSSQQVRWAPPFGRPLEVSGPYRAPPHKYGSGHRGIDVPATPGEVILAPTSATVSFAGPVAGRGVISLRVTEQTVVSFEPVAAELSQGDAVPRGTKIGTVASGGHCYAECVHIGVRIEGEYVNPMRFFANRPVLMPWDEAG